MKSVRFSQVVERSGRPQVHSLWIAPERDPEFVRARKADRVMTVRPRGHGKADIGIVGFDSAPEPGTQILIFPKSLKPFDGREVIGVKFDLVEQPDTQNVTAPQDWKPPAKKHRGKAPKARHRGAAAEPHVAPQVVATHEPTRETRKTPPTAARRKTASAAPDSALLRQVHAALKELREGKAVAAYQRLEKAAADAEG